MWLQGLTASLSGAEKARMSAEETIRGLTERVEQAEKERDAATGRVSDFEHSMPEAEQKLNKSNALNSKLSNKLLKSEAASLMQLRRIEAFKTDGSTSSAALQSAITKAQSLDESLKEREQILSATLGFLSDAESSLEDERQAKSALDIEFADLKKHNHVLTFARAEVLRKTAEQVESVQREKDDPGNQVSRISARHDSLVQVNEQLKADLDHLVKTTRAFEVQIDGRLLDMMPDRKRKRAATEDQVAFALSEDLDGLQTLTENLRGCLYDNGISPALAVWAAEEPDLSEAKDSIRELHSVDLECKAIQWLNALPGLAEPSSQKRPCFEQMFWLFAQVHRKPGAISLDDVCTLVDGMRDDAGHLHEVMGLLQIFIKKFATRTLNSARDTSSDISALMILLRCIELFCRHLEGKRTLLQRVKTAFEAIRPVLDHVRSSSMIVAGLADWLEDRLTLKPTTTSWLAQKIAFYGRSEGRNITAGDHELLADGDCLLILRDAELPGGLVHVCWPDSVHVEYALAFRLLVRNLPIRGSDLTHSWACTSMDNVNQLWAMFEPAMLRSQHRQAAPQRTVFKAR
jgi:hypothetical protein